MAKISRTWSTSENIWYDEMKSIAPYIERQYEAIILTNLQTLFPDYFAVNYKKLIKAPTSVKSSKPDFALIRKDYAEWWIVEVETIGDKLSHVSQQIANFTNGSYNPWDEANYIFRIDDTLDRDKLTDVTKNIPKVLVLVDDIDSLWKAELAKYNPSICIFKVFRGSNKFELLNISGDYPYILEDQSYCHWHDLYRGLIKLSNPDVLAPEMRYEAAYTAAGSPRTDEPVSEDENRENLVKDKDLQTGSDDSVWIAYRGQLTEYKRIDIENEGVFLQPVGPCALRANDSHLLKRIKRYGYVIDIA